jgi:hypothetical protein
MFEKGFWQMGRWSWGDGAGEMELGRWSWGDGAGEMELGRGDGDGKMRSGR